MIEKLKSQVGKDLEQHNSASETRVTFGFWVYLMTDCVLFASLFATYAVLHGSTFGGPSSRDLFDLPFVFVETILLLTSSFTAGLMMLALHKQNKRLVLTLLGVTFLLGLSFVAMELTEFTHLAVDGNSWSRSGFLSAFFTLVGTHGLHITVGLIWMTILGARIIRFDITRVTARRLLLFSMFWHFLDVIWIFIFTVVYLMGVL